MKIRSLVSRGGVPAIALCAALLPFCFAEQIYSDAEAARHVGDEATVTGKVASVSKSAKGTMYVNFGKKFPRQTFSGVVFAKDAEKIGDLSQFEGKTVALKGRIDLSPGGQPQIIIKSADQMQLANGVAPATTPATPGATASTTPSTPAPPVPVPPVAPVRTTPAIPPRQAQLPSDDDRGKRIVLAANWASAPQAGDMTRKDLAALFGSNIATDESATPEDSIVIYPEVPYLAPLATVRASLHLDNTNPSRVKISTPGLPVASLVANVFNGIFPGGYTTLTLVTDSSDQVVSVHLNDANPRQRTADITDTGGYHTYNFITQRDKAVGYLVIKHHIVREGAPAGVVVVDSLLIDPNATDPNAAPHPSKSTAKTSVTFRRPRAGKVIERSRWYVPKPLVNVILRASGNR